MIRRWLPLLVFLALFMGACGKKGPLRVPDETDTRNGFTHLGELRTFTAVKSFGVVKGSVSSRVDSENASA